MGFLDALKKGNQVRDAESVKAKQIMLNIAGGIIPLVMLLKPDAASTFSECNVSAITGFLAGGWGLLNAVMTVISSRKVGF